MVEFFCSTVHKGINGLRAEFESLRAFRPNNTRVAYDQNPDKNRYRDIICADRTRVVLKNGTDYIHGNWVTEGLPSKYICTQGPLDSTIGDFWRMVWQEKVKSILMLCGVEEQGKRKCSQYWPTSATAPMQTGGLAISYLGSERKDTAFTTTTLAVTDDGREQLHVRLHQWSSWPDHGVPQSPLAPLRMIRTAFRTRATTVVHCSAGVGRTGSVVAIEMCVRHLLDGKTLDVLAMVKKLRTQRLHAVQTQVQYLYVHRVVLQSLLIKGVISEKQLEMFSIPYEAFVARQ